MGNCIPKIQSYEEVPRDDSEEELETIFEATEEGSNFVAWRARMDQLIHNLRNRQDKNEYAEI
jgi:hypothetical protein